MVNTDSKERFDMSEEENAIMAERGETGKAIGGQVGEKAGGQAGAAVGGYFGGPLGAAIGQYVGEKVGKEIGEKVGDKAEEELKDLVSGDKKSGGGGCSGGSASGDQSSDSVPGTSPSSLGDVNIEDLDMSTNQMCKKTYTVFRAIPKTYPWPQAQRDNVSDQFTPQDDLMTMEKTTRDFLKLEGKIYDPESTNPRIFASEDWIEHYEKDKNVILSLLDQYKANTLRMGHLYTTVDNNSQTWLNIIPNQDCKEFFQTNILWTSRTLKDWSNNWFINRNSYSITNVEMKDHWLPGLTGKMVKWMKVGEYEEFNVKPIAIETMIRKVDMLEAVIDRLMSPETVSQTISKFVNLKETLEQNADQTKDKVFTSKIIDSTMGKKLGVTDTGIENHKIEGTKYIPPKPDMVEYVILMEKLSPVKKLFQQLREKSMDALKEFRFPKFAGPGPFPDIWTNISDLAEPVYEDLEIMNELIEDAQGDYENPGKHCSVTHQKLDPDMLKLYITAFKCIIQTGVIEVMANQLALPKMGLNKLDSMFNQLWEYGEKGPTMELPTWCQMAIDSINAFEDSMLDAWTEVYDCWEREFITRLWRIMVEHHGGGSDGFISCPSNWIRHQLETVSTSIDHVHPVEGVTFLDGPGDAPHVHGISFDTQTSPGDGNWISSDMVGELVCPGHLPDLLKPVCVSYKVNNIAHLSQNYRSDVKALCEWMCAAIEAVGLKFAAISAVMSDPTLNGNDMNLMPLGEINMLREKNHNILKDVEKAYGIYSDVYNMKNKKEYDEEIALHELQPNKYSNEDQLNMTSSLQSETSEGGMDSEICDGKVEISELKPWNHLNPSENHIEPKPLPAKEACNKFEKIIKTMANFETFHVTD